MYRICSFISFVCIFLLLLSCITTGKNRKAENPVTELESFEFSGNIYKDQLSTNDVVGVAEFSYEKDTQFTMNIKTTKPITVQAYDTQFEGQRYKDVTYKVYQGKFSGTFIVKASREYLFISDVNKDGLIAYVVMKIGKGNKLSFNFDIRTKEAYDRAIDRSKADIPDFFSLYVRAEYARLRGFFIK